MARRTIVSMTDDLDGGSAERTVSFGVDGHSYEIDLSRKNAVALEKILAPYVAAGRRTRSGSRAGRSAGVSRNRRTEVTAIRAWAQANGHAVSERGRIPSAILDAYAAAGTPS